MKTYTIYKDWYLMSQEEKNEFLEDGDLLACYLDNYHEDIDTYNQEEFEEYCQEMNDNSFDYKFCGLENQKVVVIGELGLWNGNKKIYPKEFDNVKKAVYACLEDYNEIYEDSYGNLHILAYHHDGTNHFIVKKLVDNKLRCLHFRKEVFGC